MTALVAWKTRWYQPGESLWSVANKLAYAACASVRDVLGLLAGVADRCREGWLFPSTEQAVAVCELLGVPLDHAKGRLFADVHGLPDLQEREHWQLAIRYCPQCLEGFVHRTAFQDRRVTHCPVHQVPLQGGCPACRSPLDPLGQAPWTCCRCGYELVAPGLTWTRQFRAGPVLKVVAQAAKAEAGPQPLLIPSPLLREWVAHGAYEEHSAIWSTLLGPHAACTHQDLDVFNANEMPARFTCPVAGAAWLSAKTFGIRPQFSAGGWVMPKPSSSAGLETGMFLATTLPVSDADIQVRALVRCWTLDLLKAFAAAAKAGKTVAVWDGGTWPVPPARAAIFRQLATVTAQAGAQCGFRRADPSRIAKSRR